MSWEVIATSTSPKPLPPELRAKVKAEYERIKSEIHRLDYVREALASVLYCEDGTTHYDLEKVETYLKTLPQVSPPEASEDYPDSRDILESLVSDE